jgi:hypothetical protein
MGGLAGDIAPRPPLGQAWDPDQGWVSLWV